MSGHLFAPFKIRNNKPSQISGPPSTPNEYLTRVRFEANQLPDVVVAPINSDLIQKQTPYIPVVPTSTPCPAEFLPSEIWQREFCSTFANTRQMVNHFNATHPEIVSKKIKFDKSQLLSICLGSEFYDNMITLQDNNDMEIDMINEEEIFEPTLPTLSTLASYDQVSKIRLFCYLVDYFGIFPPSRILCLWIYSILACLEKPLSADVCASMRNLYRRCTYIRAHLAENSSEFISSLNIFITIITTFFKQTQDQN